MNYHTDDRVFQSRLEENKRLKTSALTTKNGVPLKTANGVPVRFRSGTFPLFPGIGVYRQTDPNQMRRQIRAARGSGAKGFCLFCYASFFPSADEHELIERDEDRRKERVRVIRSLFRL